MRETTGNLWDQTADVFVITTNGSLRRDGSAVMGKGCALEAAQKWPAFPMRLGRMIACAGNRTCWFSLGGTIICALPVKQFWYEKASLSLIRQSTLQMVEEVDARRYKTIVLPRPGCGAGLLNWEDVKPVLEEILDDRFTVITF